MERENKRAAIYPYNRKVSSLIRYSDLLSGYEIVSAIVPNGFNALHKDVAILEKRTNMGILGQTCFSEGIKNCDILIVAEFDSDTQFRRKIIENVIKAMSEGKDILSLFMFDEEEERIFNRMADVYSIKYTSYKNFSDLTVPYSDSLRETYAPIILVAGINEECQKFDIQLELKKYLENGGYRVTQIGSKHYSELFGIHSFPQFMYDTEGVLWPIKLIKALVQYSSVTFLLLKFSPILSLVFIFTSVPQAISTTRLETDLNQSDIDTMEEQRKKEYYKSILLDKKYAKDLRIYRCREYFTEKYQNEWNKILSIKERVYKSSFTKIYTNELVHTIGYIYIMINSFYKAINGGFSIGDLSIVINATKSSSEAFDELFGLFAHFKDITTTRISIYLEFLKSESKIKSGSLECPDDFDIEFCNVFFRYPYNEKNTLEDISFKLQKGSKNAIVGKNGEGKSTIIKLLLRLYDPQQGKILINGTNIKEFDVVSLRKKFAVCLQEVVEYAMTVEENITFSATKANQTDLENIARLSGINNKISSFEKKYETELTKEFYEEGEELSGGQWQMIAIARALYHNSDYWIMDEPSSALDPVSEDKMMEMLSQCSKEKTTLVISHRLSSLKDYDQIIVLEKKKIIEIGSHKELLSKNGLYAKMYNLQKSKYEVEKK